jgi:transposase
MGNLGAHRPKRIRELIEQHERELIYLPAYCPDYDPIEKKRLPRSRTCSARPRPGAKRPWWKH